MSSSRAILAVAVATLVGLRVAAPAADAVSYKLTQRDGRAVIESSAGETVPWACYSLGPDTSLDEWFVKYPDLIGAGVHLFQLCLWDTKGKFLGNPMTSTNGAPVAEPPATITWREMAPRLITADPRARFIMRFGVLPDLAWRAAHPDQYPRLDGEKAGVLRDGLSVNPSYASTAYLDLARQNVRDAVAWCERQEWRDRIVGYTVFNFAEGATDVALFNVMFDESAPMQDAFREFLQRKYATVEALRAAWGDAEIAFAAVRVPSRSEWFEKKTRLNLMHWPDPAKVARERDYFLLQKELYHRYWRGIFDEMAAATAARPVLKGYDTFKQHMQGWLHNADFEALWGEATMDRDDAILFASGAAGIGPLLDHPGIDMLQTPGMYYNRAMGYAWEAEGLSDSLTLRGKVNFMEADMRTWVRKGFHGRPYADDYNIPDAGIFMNEREMTAGFERTLAWALTRNQMYYFASVCGGNWWYHEPPIVKRIAAEALVMDAAGRLPWRNTTDAVALIVDDESPLFEDFSAGFQHLAVYRQIEEGLALCGVPYRIHLLSDLALDTFPDYKCYLFPNLFRVDAATEALLRRKVLRDGHVAVFGPATGITDGLSITSAPATRLLGVPMEIVAKRTARRVMLPGADHPIARRLPAMTYGDGYSFGPLLVPARQRLADDGPARPLGAGFYFYFFDRPGAFVTDFGKGGAGSAAEGPRGAADYAVVFSPAVPLPPELLRECARYAGCHVWSDENAVVYASDGLLGYHTARSGRHVLQLPGRCTVRQLADGAMIAKNVTQFEVDVTGPATLLYRIERKGAPAARR